MPSLRTILIYGHDPILLETRRWVLEKAGFQVLTVGKLGDVTKIVHDEPVDLLLLCHTLTPTERQTVLAKASAAQPRTKQLVMTSNSQEVGQEEVEGKTLHSFAGAPGLIAAARSLLDKNDADSVC